MVNSDDSAVPDPARDRAGIAAPARLLRARWGSWRPAVAGALAASVAMAASELVAGLVPGTPSLVGAIGALMISLQPPGAKDLAVGLFGTDDKLALSVSVIALALVVAAASGVLAARRRLPGGAVFVAFGILAAAAALRDPLASPLLAVGNAGLAVAVGLVALRYLLGLADRSAVAGGADVVAERAQGGADQAGVADTEAGQVADHSTPEWARRRFLIASAGTLGGAIVAGRAGRFLLDAQHADAVVSSSKIPAPLLAVPPLAADQVLATPGLTPLVVPNADFYRIDIELLSPRVELATWQLAVTGMVAHPLAFSYDELLAMPLYEQYVTIACVSNAVGGDLVGNTLWTGVRLKDVLDAAGVQPGATQIVGRSVDDFTVGFPTAWAMAPDREPMIVVGMNREPLPAAHGFPARLIVPGLYGYVSAAKWLASIELTTREGVDGYWVPLGWAKDAPILTQSRIDVPTSGASVASGTVDVAGVAWAPDRGIAAVEVRIDDGAWQAARISRPISTATWVQWTLAWVAAPGRHSLEVRAIDGAGDVQTDQASYALPDGARGHHRIFVTVV